MRSEGHIPLVRPRGIKDTGTVTGKSQSSSSSIEHRLTIRYLLALVIVASIIATTYFVLAREISSTKNSAAIINIAGMQRMLSQRIALSSLQARTAIGDNERDAAIDRLRSAITRMQQNHEDLLHESAASGIADTHPAALVTGDPLDVQVRGFLRLASAVVAVMQEPATVDAIGVAADRLNDALNRNLLENLNAYVFELQSVAEKKTARFLSLERMFLLFGLIALVLEVFFIFRPMTRQIGRTLSAVETSNDELRQFSYRVSHDLRAPISSTIGLVGIGEDALKNGRHEIAVGVFSRIGQSMKRLDSLISDIIAVTKNKQLTEIRSQINVAELVDQVFSKLEHMPGAASISLLNRIPVTLELVTRKTLLMQILENLASNAIKYSDPEKSLRYVEVKIKQSPDALCIEVADNGIGVPKEARAHIFGMFQRFHPGISNGSGLGLYLVRQNAQALGGDITYRPTLDGSCFTLQLPNGEVDR